VLKFELTETQFERVVRDQTKSPVKSTCSEKINVLSTFLKSSLNFLSNNLKNLVKNTTKFGIVREKSSVKVRTDRNTV